MIIKNNTNQVQELTIYARTSNGIRPYSVYVVAGGSYETETSIDYPTLQSLLAAGIFSVVGEEGSLSSSKVLEVPEVQGTPVFTEPSFEAEGASEGKHESETPGVIPEESEAPAEVVVPTEVLSSYTCPKCGSEFASERGLKMHLSRSHNEG